jgi:hypothetical protein
MIAAFCLAWDLQLDKSGIVPLNDRQDLIQLKLCAGI